MNYKRLDFNLTLAKLISQGSVKGRVDVIKVEDGSYMGTAQYLHQLGTQYKYVFNVSWDSDADSSLPSYPIAFDDEGMYICPNGEPVKLVIEIPVEESQEECLQTADSCDSLKQENDKHYHKLKIEPIDYILANNLGFCEGNVVKYITRYKDKGGIDDLRKIKEYVDYLIEDMSKQSDD